MASHPHHLQHPGSAPGMPHPQAVMQPSMHYPQAQPQLQGPMQPQMHYQQIQKQQLAVFWQQQIQEMEQINEEGSNDSSNEDLLRFAYNKFKNHQLPLARIKKIMKSDEDVKMIAAEAPVLFAKACEMFILELTLRSWIHTEENKRRTLQRNDIAGAITRGDIFDFLVDIVPRDELKEEDVPWSGVGDAGDPSVPYGQLYYPPTLQQPLHHPMGAADMMVVQPAMPPNPQMMYPPPQ